MIFFLSITGFLEVTLLRSLSASIFEPNVILVSLILCVPFFNLEWLLFFAFGCGAFLDVVGSLSFGFNTIFFCLWVILAKYISRKLSFENALIRTGAIFFIILFNNLFILFYLLLSGSPVNPNFFLKLVLGQISFAFLLSLPIYKLYTYFFSK